MASKLEKQYKEHMRKIEEERKKAQDKKQMMQNFNDANALLKKQKDNYLDAAARAKLLNDSELLKVTVSCVRKIDHKLRVLSKLELYFQMAQTDIEYNNTLERIVGFYNDLQNTQKKKLKTKMPTLSKDFKVMDLVNFEQEKLEESLNQLFDYPVEETETLISDDEINDEVNRRATMMANDPLKDLLPKVEAEKNRNNIII